MKPVKQIFDLPFTVEAPWPYVNLSPNTRQNEIRLAIARKKHKAACMQAFMGQGLRRMKLADGVQLNLTMVFTPPVTRTHDDDNLIIRMKAGRDALAAVIGVDDNRFHVQPITILKADRRGAKVTITVEVAA